MSDTVNLSEVGRLITHYFNKGNNTVSNRRERILLAFTAIDAMLCSNIDKARYRARFQQFVETLAEVEDKIKASKKDERKLQNTMPTPFKFWRRSSRKSMQQTLQSCVSERKLFEEHLNKIAIEFDQILDKFDLFSSCFLSLSDWTNNYFRTKNIFFRQRLADKVFPVKSRELRKAMSVL